ncbi:MAG: hypothetical protein ACYDAG_03045 [Chloroflexota bacterium]
MPWKASGLAGRGDEAHAAGQRGLPVSGLGAARELGPQAVLGRLKPVR